MKTILVTGGAGYIGSVCVHKLISLGYKVIVIDNLSKGMKHLIHKDAEFYQLDLKDSLEKPFRNQIHAVIHFAAYKAVGESMENAPKYSDNITGTINLLNHMVKHNVKKIIFSSTAAVYGIPEYTPLNEDHPTNPENFYGASKLECERILAWYSRIHNLQYVSLRYFNVVGDALNYLDPEPENILPIIMEVITKKRSQLTIFGDDYNTRDGTCLRDYIDVNDLIDAHIKALELNTNEIINLATSNGTTVLELIKLTEKALQTKLNFKRGDRRKGDPGVVIASNKKALDLLKWKPTTPLLESIKSTYKAYK